MKILFHCASGNTDRPGRWKTINSLFTDLGETLIRLGHEVSIMTHPSASHPKNTNSPIEFSVSSDVSVEFIDRINPDVCITWNGNSDGDQQFINYVGRDKMIFGELGFFGHYDKTCYFDRCGVNTRHSIIGRKFSDEVTTEVEDINSKLIQHYKKNRIFSSSFIFVPLQDETDTQITQFSPFSSMDDFVHHVFDIFRFDSRPILYKRHPLAPSHISIKHPRLIEVTEDVHHYIPYADLVFGLNSTVMVESLLYHSNVVTYGAGIGSRGFNNDAQRKNFIAQLYSQQISWEHLSDTEKVQDSYFYSLLLN